MIFFSMAERKVARFEKGKVIVDTCAVTDSDKPYETGISHPSYNKGDWVIVELYDTKGEAKIGHKKWVKKLTSKRLPKTLKDVSTATVANFCDSFGKTSWRTYKKKSKRRVKK